MTRPQPEKTDTRKFTSGAVKDLVKRNLKGNFKPPNDAVCHRLADAFNRIYEREAFGEVHDSPHIFWHAGVTLPRGKIVRKGKRWHRFARELAETIQTELSVRLSDNGPVIRVTLAVIFEITGEKPTTTASVVREVRRQQRKA
jgi:hypothetical protein